MEQEQTEIDVINFAGLLMNDRDDRFEAAIRERLNPRSLKTIAPTPFKSAKEHPDRAVERAMEMIGESSTEIERKFGVRPRFLFLGRSYGGFTGIRTALRMDFRDILGTVAVEAPLHPDVLVQPPDFPVFSLLKRAQAHYDVRPELAREMVRELGEKGTSKITLVQGNQRDGIVPVEAQTLPGDFDRVVLTNGEEVRHNGRGLSVQLPPHLGGDGRGLKRVIPTEFLLHVYWSREKMVEVMRIVAAAANVQ